MVFLGARDHVHQPTEIVLHCLDRSQAVQRLDNEISVPDPTKAIVPVPSAVWCFGYACGNRGDDRAGLFICAKFQRNRRANDCFLPVERQGQAPCPAAPVVQRSFFETPGGLGNTPGQGFVGTKNKIQGIIEIEFCLVQKQVNGSVCREPEREIRAHIADVIGTVCSLWCDCAVTETRPKTDANTRTPRDWEDAPYKGLGPKDAVPPTKARCAVANLDRALRTMQSSDKNGRIRFVELLGFGCVHEIDCKHAVFRRALGRAEQRMKDGIAVETRQATPDNTSLTVNQCSETTVSNNAKFKSAQRSLSRPDDWLRLEANRETEECRLPDSAPASVPDRP